MAGILTVCLAPLVVATGLRLWLGRVARQQALRIEIGKIEAPFLRPVVIHDLHVTNDPAAPFRLEANATRAEFDLNLRALLGRSNGRLLRSFSIDGITADFRKLASEIGTAQPSPWQTLETLLADDFKFSVRALHIENGSTILDLREGVLSGSEMESGIFSAATLQVSSPVLQKSFANLRGVTSWQESRLTVGAVILMRGLDLDAVRIDLSQIHENRLGFEMSVDAFGGKIRASLSSDDRPQQRIWDATGSAAEISIAQMSDALGWTNRASGSLHACKFTFHGETTDVRNATASVWAEVTGLTWRDRTADTIMVGASLHNREVQIEQLYVKQRDNQLTLSGEFALPQRWIDLPTPEFRGDISASLNDLGSFARLFGQSPSDFAGKIAIDGSVNARDRKLGGALAVSGDSLLLFRAPVDTLRAKLAFKESRLEVEQFELARKDDSFRGDGTLDLTGERPYSLKFTSAVADIAEYAALIPEPFAGLELSGRLDLSWTGTGRASAHSGAFHASGRALQTRRFGLSPFDAEFEGDYTPENIFFRQFHLSNQRADLTAFVTIASEYLDVQGLRLALNGKTRFLGNAFAPVSVAKLIAHSGWLASLSSDPIFDINLSTDWIDVSELAAAVSAHPNSSGQLAAKIELYGSPASLQGRSDIHLRDLVWDGESRLSADLESSLAAGQFNLKGNALARGSDPVTVEAAFPLRLEKQDAAYALKSESPLNGTLRFPAIFLAKTPRYLNRGVFHDGILSGELAISDSLGHPQFAGDIQLIGGKFGIGAALSTAVTFSGQTGKIEFAQLKQGTTQFVASGAIDLHDAPDIAVKLVPSAPLADSTFLEPGDCVAALEFSTVPARGSSFHLVREIDLRGTPLDSAWTVSLTWEGVDPLVIPPQIFPFCAEGKTLTLRAAP